MTIEEMIAKKKEFGYSCEMIASMSGVPLSTVQKIFSGITSSPRNSTLKALARVFEWPARPIPDADYLREHIGVSYVAEDTIGYGKANGRTNPNTAFNGTSALDMSSRSGKTLDDYLALPDDVRVELIDGVFYDMAAPSLLHQSIALCISTVFANHIDSHNGKCMAFVAPVDVQLDCDEKTVVEPDVLIVCDRDKLDKPRVVGAPDLTIEVVSPSSWYHDSFRKLQKYKKAGVREYWIVIPDELKIIVYNFEKSDFLTEYSFDDKVPVGIWNGECEVDFKKIYEKISFML